MLTAIIPLSRLEMTRHSRAEKKNWRAKRNYWHTFIFLDFNQNNFRKKLFEKYWILMKHKCDNVYFVDPSIWWSDQRTHRKKMTRPIHYYFLWEAFKNISEYFTRSNEASLQRTLQVNSSFLCVSFGSPIGLLQLYYLYTFYCFFVPYIVIRNFSWTHFELV